jgi:hypothetical protein
MGTGFPAAVSFYGAKSEPFAQLLRTLQGIVRHEIGIRFRSYAIEQVHGTVVTLDAAPDRATGCIVHEHYRDVTGNAVPVDAGHALALLRVHLARPCRVRLGGYRPASVTTFQSRGRHPYERMFSEQGGAFVVIGWPVPTIEAGLAVCPLDDLRRDMNTAGIMHRYHESCTDVDNDLHFVLGHHNDAPAERVSAAVGLARAYLAEHPIDIDLGIDQVSVVVGETTTLASATFVGKVTTDEAAILRLFES